MLELVVVTPADELGADYLNEDAVLTFANVKLRVLGYTEASIRTLSSGHNIGITAAPLGAVKTREEAQALLDALATELPRKHFRVDTKMYPDADEVVWHSPGE
jgi:hypothetical protein